MSDNIIQFPGAKHSARMMKACEEAARIIESECVRQTQKHMEPEYLSFTNVSEEALNQMAIWALVAWAHQDATAAIKLANSFVDWARAEYEGDPFEAPS